MYLMAVNSLQALCQVLELIPIEVTNDNHITLRNGTAWSDVCSVLGYLDIVTCWNGNLVIIWTMLYMLVLSWRIHRVLVDHTVTSPTVTDQASQSASKIYQEILCVILLLVAPFLFSWIPYVKDMYGPSGLWCWIKTISTTESDEDRCGHESFQHLSLALMLIMFYGPLAVILTFGLVCMIVVIVLVWTGSKHLHGCNRQKHRNNMKEIGFVLAYPIIYWIFCSFLLVNRIYSSVNTNSKDLPPYYPLWIIHAVADPARIVIPALAFLLHPHVWKNILSSTFKNTRFNATSTYSTYAEYSVPPEDDDIDEGIKIRPSKTDYGSTKLFPNTSDSRM